MDDFNKYTDYKTVLSVNALIWCNGKVLMLKRADTKKVDPGFYAGIGGKVEFVYRDIDIKIVKKIFNIKIAWIQDDNIPLLLQ